jgi:hypothetical protein
MLTSDTGTRMAQTTIWARFAVPEMPDFLEGLNACSGSRFGVQRKCLEREPNRTLPAPEIPRTLF